MKFSLFLSMCLVGAAAPASAAMLYNINFTGGSPNATGSFLYDSGTPAFTNFIVTYNGHTNDLTAAANNPNLFGTCDTAAPNAADFFAALQGTCGPMLWGAEFPGPGQFFRITTGSPTPNCTATSLNGACIETSRNSGGGGGVGTNGTLTIAW